MEVDKKTGFPRHPAAKGLLLQASVSTENGVDEWVYSPTTLKIEDGIPKMTEPNILVDKGEMFIDMKKNPDLAFYCLQSRKVGRNEKVKAKFHIVDTEGMTVEAAEIRRKEGKMVNLIYSAIPEGNLRTLAKSWGVLNVNDRVLDLVRTDLEAKILANEASKKKGNPNMRGIDEFIGSSEVNFYDQVAALVRDADDKGTLNYEADNRRWVIDYKDSNTPYILKELAAGEFQNPTETLIKFLISENEKLVKLELAMGAKPKEKEAVKELTMEKIMGISNYLQLKKMVTENVPDFVIEKGVTKTEDLKQALMSAIATAQAEG